MTKPSGELSNEAVTKTPSSKVKYVHVDWKDLYKEELAQEIRNAEIEQMEINISRLRELKYHIVTNGMAGEFIQEQINTRVEELDSIINKGE